MCSTLAPSTVEHWLEYERLRADAIALRRNIGEVTETAYSPDGLVRATAGPGAELVELRLDPRIYRTVDAAALAETITATVREARAGANTQLSELAKPFLSGVPGLGAGFDNEAAVAFERILRRRRSER